jgi:hypothetical protein
LQEILLLQQHAEAHLAAFGKVQWDKLAAEQFGGRRMPHKLQTVYTMLQKAKVRAFFSQHVVRMIIVVVVSIPPS